MRANEIVDCVEKQYQHGFESPIAQFATPPPTPPGAGPSPLDASLTGQEYGSKTKLCPDGTVPRRRARLDELKRFPTLEAYLAAGKRGGSDPEPPPPGAQRLMHNHVEEHEYAAFRQVVTNIGTEALLDLRSPYTQLSNEFSLSQLWVSRGDGANRQTVEVGWQVYEDKWGDGLGRLFIFYTPDDYANGCYNTECSGFVQVSGAYVLGGAFSFYSTPGGAERTVHLRMQMSTARDWWVAVNGTWIGYWPNSLFNANGIANQGARVTYGGEIINRQPNGIHTATDMGSGYFPSAGYTYAAFQRRMRYYAGTYANPTLMDVVPNVNIITRPACYDATHAFSTGGGGRYMFFGGWGFNWTTCT